MKKILILILLSLTSVSFSQTKREYFDNGFKKIQSGKFQDGISDFSKAIRLDPKFSQAYFGRGIAKLKVNLKESACIDLKKSSELGYVEAIESFNEFCN